MQLKIEREALKKESDKASKDRLAALEHELAELEEQSGSLTAKWQAEKKSVQSVQNLKEQLDRARAEVEIAQRRGDFAKAGELTYGVIPGLEKQIAEIDDRNKAALVNEAVTPENIAQVVSRWTGIPVDKMLEGEREKLLHMETALEGRVVGPERGCARHRQRRAPFARRTAGPEPAHRLVPVPRTHGCRQDRTHQGAGVVPVRRRQRDGAHRHERVHGKACRIAPDRCAAGLCRIRGRRRAHRSGATPAVSGDPVRRGRKGRITTCSTCCCRCSTTDG